MDVKSNGGVGAANPEPNLLGDSSVKTENHGSPDLVAQKLDMIKDIKPCKVVLTPIDVNLLPSWSRSTAKEASLGSKKERVAQKRRRTYDDEWQRGGKALLQGIPTTSQSVAESALLMTAKVTLHPLEQANKSSLIEELGNAKGGTALSLDVPEKVQATIAEAKRTRRTLEEIKEEMKKELENKPPNRLDLSVDMAKTFSHRKMFYLNNPEMDLNTYLNQYPAIQLFQIALEELCRILGNKITLNQLDRKLTKHFDQALDLTKLKKKRAGDKPHPLFESTIKRWQSDPNCSPGKTNEMKKVLGMLILCFDLVKNDIVTTHLCRFQPNENKDTTRLRRPTLVLLNENQIFDLTEISIYVDGQEFLKVPNFYQGVLCVYATYYILNILYDRPLIPLFKFFDGLVGGNVQPTK